MLFFPQSVNVFKRNVTWIAWPFVDGLTQKLYEQEATDPGYDLDPVVDKYWYLFFLWPRLYRKETWISQPFVDGLTYKLYEWEAGSFFCWQIFVSQASSKFASISPSPSLVLAPDYLSIITHILSINPLLQICYSGSVFYFPYMAIFLYGLLIFNLPQPYKKYIFIRVILHVIWVSNLIEWPRCGCVLKILM